MYSNYVHQIDSGLVTLVKYKCFFVTAQDVSRELLYSSEAQLSDQLT